MLIASAFRDIFVSKNKHTKKAYDISKLLLQPAEFSADCVGWSKYLLFLSLTVNLMAEIYRKKKYQIPYVTCINYT